MAMTYENGRRWDLSMNLKVYYQNISLPLEPLARHSDDSSPIID